MSELESHHNWSKSKNQKRSSWSFSSSTMLKALDHYKKKVELLQTWKEKPSSVWDCPLPQTGRSGPKWPGTGAWPVLMSLYPTIEGPNCLSVTSANNPSVEGVITMIF
jgi:hypothetical protein